MQKIISFTQNTHYTGRNGEGTMIGIEVLTGEFVTYLSPINSKGQVAHCELQIPYEDMEELLLVMQEALEKRNRPYDK